MGTANETAANDIGEAAGDAGQAAPAWRDGWYWSNDGLRLHWRELGARESPGSDRRPTLLCIPGLTRNTADFRTFGERLGGRWRVVAVDLRGRGESAWPKDSLTYVPLTYLLDLGRLIDAAGIGRFVAIGSSVGGSLAALLATGHRAAMAGLVLNDIGPDIQPAGLARMRANVGRSTNWPTWIHAARDLAQRNGGIYPDWQLADWLAFAKRLCRVGASGRIGFDYDPRIAEAFRLPHGEAGNDARTALAMLAGVPMLSLRGELSDVLTGDDQARLAAQMPGMTIATVPRVGHAPTLGEPAAVAAIDAFLDRIAAAGPD